MLTLLLAQHTADLAEWWPALAAGGPVGVIFAFYLWITLAKSNKQSDAIVRIHERIDRQQEDWAQQMRENTVEHQNIAAVLTRILDRLDAMERRIK